MSTKKDKTPVPPPVPTNPLVDPVMQSAIAFLYKRHTTFYDDSHKKAGQVSSRNHWNQISADLKLLVGASMHPDYLRNNRVREMCLKCHR